MKTRIALPTLSTWLGLEVALSDWVEITQQRIDQFAEATGDRQWIHVDPIRAAKESPFGTTVAHGFLTLSLVPLFKDDCLEFTGVRMAINYGCNRVRFMAPVKVGTRLRGRFKVLAIEEIKGGVQLTMECTIEAEGSDKPVCVAELVTRLYA